MPAPAGGGSLSPLWLAAGNIAAGALLVAGFLLAAAPGRRARPKGHRFSLTPAAVRRALGFAKKTGREGGAAAETGRPRFRQDSATGLASVFPTVRGTPGPSEEAEKAQRELLEEAGDGFFLAGPGGRFLMANARGSELLGYTPRELTALTIADVLADQEGGASPFGLRVLLKGQEVMTERRLRRKDGTVFPAEIYARQLPNGNLRGLVRDISRRRRTEEALKESQRLLQAVFDAIPHWVYAKDRESRYFMVNQLMAQDFDKAPEDFVGKTLPELGVGSLENHEVMSKTDRSVLEGEERVDLWGHEAVLASGEERLMRIIKLPLRDQEGKVAGIVGIAEDISEGARAQAEISRLAAVVEQTSNTILITDHFGKVTYVNAAFEALTGFPAGEILGRRADQLLPGEGDAHPLASIQKNLLKGQRWEGRYTILRKNRTPVRIEAIHSPLRNVTGEVEEYIAFWRDVTVEEQLEEELRHSQRMEAVGALAGGIAHDFNNLLMPVIGFTEIALDEGVDPDSMAAEHLGTVLQSAQRARDLVQQILVFGRKTPHTLRPLQIGPLVEEVLKLIRPTLPTTIRIRCGVAKHLPPVMGDPTQIHQVVMNLCVNAAQAMPAGGELELAIEERELDPNAVRVLRGSAGRHVQITVRDSGTGIEAETLPHIFEPFFTTKHVGQGSGLGLSTLYGIVKQHRGAINVTSAPGQGATFEIFLPVAEGEQAPGVARGPAPRGNGERILVVDDEPAVAKFFQASLGRMGYEVTTLTDSEKALESVRRDPGGFDLVLTDLTMPGMTGLALAAKIRRLRRELPIILCTGATDPPAGENARRKGVSEVLFKPTDQAEMGQVVAAVLARARGVEEAGRAAAGGVFTAPDRAGTRPAVRRRR